MIVSGDIAKEYHAVRLDDFRDAHAGPLVSADDQTGEVSWTDASGETKRVTLGMHTIKILRRR